MAALFWVGGLPVSRAEPPAPDAHWLDVESQIQYSFYSEDRRALENLTAALPPATAGLSSAYFVSLAQYRLAEILRERDPRLAAMAAQRCVQTLESASGADRDPEALALDAACIDFARRLGGLRFALLGASAEDTMARALRLAPRNPRVVLLDGVIAYEHANSRGERGRTLARFQQSVQLFELERQGMTASPGWGAAEAYAYLGRVYLERGDALAARGALERALLLAPDFLGARKLLAQIVGG